MVYFFLLWFHIISIISWMVGLFYLPRLFVYHCGVKNSETDSIFILMESRLARIIMIPAMLSSWFFGLALAFWSGSWKEMWFLVKFLLVVGLTFFHIKLSVWRKAFFSHKNTHSEGFFRKINEVPTVFMIVIVFLVVFKPDFF